MLNFWCLLANAIMGRLAQQSMKLVCIHGLVQLSRLYSLWNPIHVTIGAEAWVMSLQCNSPHPDYLLKLQQERGKQAEFPTLLAAVLTLVKVKMALSKPSTESFYHRLNSFVFLRTIYVCICNNHYVDIHGEASLFHSFTVCAILGSWYSPACCY